MSWWWEPFAVQQRWRQRDVLAPGAHAAGGLACSPDEVVAIPAREKLTQLACSSKRAVSAQLRAGVMANCVRRNRLLPGPSAGWADWPPPTTWPPAPE